MAGGHGPHPSLLEVTWNVSAHISCTKAYCEEGRTGEEWEMLSCSQEERNWNDYQSSNGSLSQAYFKKLPYAWPDTVPLGTGKNTAGNIIEMAMFFLTSGLSRSTLIKSYFLPG